MDAGIYDDKSNVPYCKAMCFKFFPDAANQPTVPASPFNLYITSITRVSQGLYRITLRFPFRNIVNVLANLQVNGAGVVRFVQPGPVNNVGTSTPVTVDLLVVDAAGAVQDPPATNANNCIWGQITFADVGPI